MSKGPGRVQRVILALIQADPHGAWTTENLCVEAYPDSPSDQKKERVAVLRALKRMTLPGTWEVGVASLSYCLYDPRDGASSARRIYLAEFHEERREQKRLARRPRRRSRGYFSR
jgi:hypothetical protein